MDPPLYLPKFIQNGAAMTKFLQIMAHPIPDSLISLQFQPERQNHNEIAVSEKWPISALFKLNGSQIMILLKISGSQNFKNIHF